MAALLIVACGSIAAESVPLTTPHGGWIATQRVSLFGVVCAACSIAYRTSGAHGGRTASGNHAKRRVNHRPVTGTWRAYFDP